MSTDHVRDTIRDAASTLAFHWAEGPGGHKDRLGVERLIRAYPTGLQLPLCANILLMLERSGHHAQAVAFEALLFSLADEEACQ